MATVLYRASGESKCGDEISEKRLRALPFAVRCKGCEEAREAVDERTRQLVRTRERSPLLFDMSG